MKCIASELVFSRIRRIPTTTTIYKGLDTGHKDDKENKCTMHMSKTKLNNGLAQYKQAN